MKARGKYFNEAGDVSRDEKDFLITLLGSKIWFLFYNLGLPSDLLQTLFSSSTTEKY